MGTILADVNFASIATTAALGGALVGVSYVVKGCMKYSGAPPGPRRIPVIGNVEFAPGDGASFVDMLQSVCKKYGPIICMYIGYK